ncbi:MAG: hypothetical protein AAGJ93_07455 [Bacteroidota bacterium]
MKQGILYSILVVLSLVTIMHISSCANDQLPEPMEAECAGETPTYTDDIKLIIDESCAYSGCHLDSSPGRFDSYSGLLSYLDDNTFRQRVIVQRADPSAGMPPNYAPDGRLIDLTEAQIELVECWLDAGHPE